MKNTFFVISVLGFALIGSSAFAGHNASGCGVGSLIFKENDKGSQILGSLTDGYLGVQTFAMTSGTSNCSEDGVTAANKQIPMFVEVNQTALARDISRGSGDTLSSFSKVLGCNDTSRLGSTLQANYGRIFPSASGDPTWVSSTILNVINEDAALKSSCHVVASAN